MATQKELLETIVRRLKSVEKTQPNGELKRMEVMMMEMHERIMDPENGLVVQISKNTHFRKECEPKRAKHEENLKVLLRWKTFVDWGFGIGFVAVVGAVVRFFISK